MLATHQEPEITLPTLNDYQERMVSETNAHIAEGQTKILIFGPTGCGKTIVGGQLAFEYLVKGWPVLFLTNRDILLSQTLKTLNGKYGLPCGVLAGVEYKKLEDRSAPVQIASTQTLDRRQLGWLLKWFNPKLILQDECHLLSYSEIGRQCLKLSGIVNVGLTGSPWRLSSDEEMGDLFDVLVKGPMPWELIRQGRLKKPIYYVLERKTRCSTPDAIAHIVNKWHQLAKGRKTIAFTEDIAHAKALALAFTLSEVNAAFVDGNMSPTKRKDFYDALEKGDLQILCSCEAISEGFDVPNINCVLLCRETSSRAKYFQQVGRGLRFFAGMHDCLILDQAWLHRKPGFGRVEDLLDVSLTKSSRRNEGGILPEKYCPVDMGGCGLRLAVFAKTCSCCGYRFPQQSIPPLSPFHAMVLKLPEEERSRVASLRHSLRNAYQGKQEIEVVISTAQDLPQEWRHGAMLGDNPTFAQKGRYIQFLQTIAARDGKSSSWVQEQIMAEFGSLY